MADALPGAVAPVENAPAAQAVPAPDAPVVGDAEQLDKPVQPPKTYTEEDHRKGISDRLAKERRRLERTIRAEVERDYLRDQVQATRNPPQERGTQPQGAPKLEDFGGDWESYVIAKAKHEFRQEQQQEGQKRNEQTTRQQAQQQAEERARYVRENLFVKGMEKYEDFEDVAMSDLPITEPMAAAIARLPNGHDVWYHLGQNPKEAKRIAALPDIDQVWEMKALESKLGAPPKLTQTTTPIVPNGTQVSTPKDYRDMTTEQHVKAYLKTKKR